jgi:hypothetical protein
LRKVTRPFVLLVVLATSVLTALLTALLTAALTRPPATTWSCAAQCVVRYSCTSDGDSTMTVRDVRGHGPTAGGAYQQLVDDCGGVHLASRARCVGGSFQGDPAPIGLVCVKD